MIFYDRFGLSRDIIVTLIQKLKKENTQLNHFLKEN